MRILTTGVDVDLTPQLKAIFTANAIALDTTAPIEAILFQGNIHKHLGEDISLGARYRPYLNNNVVIVGGIAGFKPGQGFEDIYERSKTLFHVFTNVILTF